MKSSKMIVAAAALSGLLAGSASFASAATAGQSRISQLSSQAGAKAIPLDVTPHDCKTQNACKGQGGCKTGDQGCKGKNSCKGNGGCKVTAPTTNPSLSL